MGLDPKVFESLLGSKKVIRALKQLAAGKQPWPLSIETDRKLTGWNLTQKRGPIIHHEITEEGRRLLAEAERRAAL